MRSLIYFIIFFVLLTLILTSCSVSKPVVKKFKVIAVNENYFTAKRCNLIVRFVAIDSVYVGKKVLVSIGTAYRINKK